MGSGEVVWNKMSFYRQRGTQVEGFVGGQGTSLISHDHTQEASESENQTSNAPHALLSTGRTFSGPRVLK